MEEVMLAGIFSDNEFIAVDELVDCRPRFSQTMAVRWNGKFVMHMVHDQPISDMEECEAIAVIGGILFPGVSE
jgi:hypothetical protein